VSDKDAGSRGLEGKPAGVWGAAKNLHGGKRLETLRRFSGPTLKKRGTASFNGSMRGGLYFQRNSLKTEEIEIVIFRLTRRKKDLRIRYSESQNAGRVYFLKGKGTFLG